MKSSTGFSRKNFKVDPQSAVAKVACILTKGLLLLAYKIQLIQVVKPTDHGQRAEFV